MGEYIHVSNAFIWSRRLSPHSGPRIPAVFEPWERIDWESFCNGFFRQRESVSRPERSLSENGRSWRRRLNSSSLLDGRRQALLFEKFLGALKKAVDE